MSQSESRISGLTSTQGNNRVNMVKKYYILGHTRYILWLTDPKKGFCALSEIIKLPGGGGTAIGWSTRIHFPGEHPPG